VLLKGENEMTIKEVIEENKEWFEEMFDTIIPRNEQFVAVDKLVWVRCRGLPLKLWNYDCFKHIAALLGTLIEVDEATLALEEMEYARFIIRVSVGCEAKITSYMKINDVLYQVSVEEECTVPDYKLCQCHRSEESEGSETEADSIASNASVQSGSRDFEEVRKVAEETSMADVSKALPPAAQGSLPRVEDSLRGSQTREAYQSPLKQNSNETKHKHTNTHFQSGSSLSRIRDTYAPFDKPTNKGDQLVANVMDNQTKQGIEPVTINSSSTMERIIFWVGESSKNNKWEERKNVRSALSHISNSVSDMAINNYNRLFWLKHGSLETIQVWELGKQLGATCRDEGNVMVSLEELEKRDRSLKLQREVREVMGYQ